MELTNLNFLSNNESSGNTVGNLGSEQAFGLNIPGDQTNQLVVIDTRVEDYVQLVEGLSADTAVLVLDPGKDGITQIDDAIEQFQSLSALHIFSHGSSAQLQLGSTQLNTETLSLYESTLESWDTVFTDTADVLIYGCNVAEGVAGQAFLEDFSQLTGADIAASTNLTGNSFLGGDWYLEAHTGVIEAAEIIDSDTLAAYAGLLNTPPVTNGLVLNLDADFGITTDGSGVVTGWEDQTGSGNILTGLGDPQLITNRINGNNVIEFDNVDDQLSLTSGLSSLPAGSADRTVFLVATYDNDAEGTGGFSYGAPEDNNTFGLVTIDGSLGIQGWRPTNDFRSQEDARGAGWLTQSVVLENNSFNHYKNGTLIDSQTHVFATDSQQLVIGAEIDGSPAVGMEVAEVLVYDRALSDSERQAVENYLQQEYTLDSYQSLGNPNFQIQTVLDDGVGQAINLETLPDGRMLILNKNGNVKITDPLAANPVATDYLNIQNVSSDFEWGLYSIALDPNFETNNYIYAYYSNNSDGNRFRISRFTHHNDHAEDEIMVWEANEEIIDTFHYGGALSFGPDGMLYLATGDVFDQPEVVQDLTRSEGKVIRIDTSSVDTSGGWVRGGNNTHLIPSDNPFVDGPGGNLDEIWAYGLRNPFTGGWDLVWDETTQDWDPEASRFFIGEVGGNAQFGFDASWEDLHVATLSDAGANFGWPFYEGPNNFGQQLPDYVPPLFSVQHQDARAIIAGEIYRGNQLPGVYQDAFFFADYAKGWLRALTFDSEGNVTNDVPDGGFKLGPNNTDLQIGNPVGVHVGPDGALYYVDFFAGALNRIVFDSGNFSPTITEAAANFVPGLAPLNVDFIASATDPENDPLTYSWDFGDGAQATGINVSHQYAANGVYDVTLTVSDSINDPVVTSLDVSVGLTPTATITTPGDGQLFRAGDLIQINGTGEDVDGTIVDYDWTVRFIHDDHFHPELSGIDGTSLSFEVSDTGHDFSGFTGYEIAFTVTDSDGLSDTEVISILPDKVDVSFASNIPGGVTFELDQLPRVGDFTHDTLIGFNHTIEAPGTVNVDGVEYVFDSWSNGITTNSFVLTVPDADQTYTANYVVGNISANAVDDTVVIDEDAVGIAIDVLANDVDPENDPLTVTQVGTASNGGTVLINGTSDGLIYTPASDFVGVETFTYSISDGSGDTSQATVKVSIRGANDAPTAVADSFNASLDSTNNPLNVLSNDLDPDIAGVAPAIMDFGTYEVTEVSTVNPNRAIKVKHVLSGGGLDNADFIFDSTPATGSDPHFHMMGMPAAMRPTYLTQHNAGGTGERINFTMAREDGQAFAFEGFSYTSGQFFAGTNGSFSVIGTLTDGSEISQVFGPATSETIFQAVTLDGAGWKNITAVRFEGSIVATGTEVTQELNIDDIIVGAASDVLTITSVGTTSNGGTVLINGANDGLVYTPLAGYSGTETFNYTIQDQSGANSTATVTVNVSETATVPITSGLVLELDAGAGVTTDGTDLVTGWLDQSGSGNDLTGAGDPRLVS
ncbi:MAG: DUF4347 domain-containing protein, partial [Cyanobacteria bacterium P01_F01_bin.116]